MCVCVCMCMALSIVSLHIYIQQELQTRIHFLHRANEVTILGTRYAKGCIIRVKDEGGQEDDPFLYTCIEDIYIHKDNKVFLLRVLTVLNHSEHFRSIRVGYSDQVFFCLYDTFFAHDILHTKEIDGQLFIVDFIHHF